MPFLLYTYLLAEVLAPLFASFILLNCILFLGKMLPMLDILLDFGISLADFVRLCAFIAPQLFLFSIPMSSMMGIILGFTRLTNDGEIIALKAAGISLYRLLPPVLVILLCTSGLTALFSIHLIPTSNIAMEKLLFQLAKEKIDKGLHEKQFSDAIGKVVLYVDNINKENGNWQGVYVTDMRQQAKPVIITAQRGSVSADPTNMTLMLHLKNGRLHRSEQDVTQNIRFTSYTITLTFSPPGGSITPQPGKRTYSLRELHLAAAKLNKNTEARASLMIEYHKRLVLPIGCFLLGLLGFSLALLTGPHQRPIGLPLGLTFFTLYFILLSAAKALSETLVLPTAPTMWFPNFFYCIITVILLKLTAAETSQIYLEKFMVINHRISAFLRRKGKPAQ